MDDVSSSFRNYIPAGIWMEVQISHNDQLEKRYIHKKYLYYDYFNL